MDDMEEFDKIFNSTDAETAEVVETANEEPSQTQVDTNQPPVDSSQPTDATPPQENNNEVSPQDNSDVDNRQQEIERHRQNNLNAQRRIRNRSQILKQKDDKIRQLEERLAKYEAKQNPNDFDAIKIDNIKEQIEDMQADYDREAREISQERLYAFNDQVAQEVGYETAQVAVPMIQRWADYVNENERELVKMTQRPYGKHLLYEWCTRMEKFPTAKSQWERMNAFEKSRKLTELYELVYKSHTEQPKPTPTQPTQTTNVAVAQSGRGETLAQPATSDDFGSALERQMQKMGIRKF